MAWGSVRLIPGVNVERTPTLNEAGVSTSQLIRYRDGLIQKFGGWTTFSGSPVTAIPRALHAWQDLDNIKWLAVGGTTQLAVISAGVLQDITPQILTTSSVAPSASTNAGFAGAVITDANIAVTYSSGGINASAITPGIDAILINAPISVAGLVISGWYSSSSAIGPGAPGVHTFSVLTGNPATSTTTGGAVPSFTTQSGSNLVKVTLNNHNLIGGQTVSFDVSTTGNGVTIFGVYIVASGAGSYVTTNSFFIRASMLASGSGSFSMNSGNAQYIYYLGTGYFPTKEQTGSSITSTDWSITNWGEILLACQANGPVFSWTPSTAATAYPVGTAPAKNGGIFVSNAQQTLICWASSGNANLNATGIGTIQNPLQVSWSTVGDYTNFFPTSTNQAGSFVIPVGSACRGGMSVASQNIIWTDIDCWAMNYIGPPLTYGFNKIGAGAGLIAQHAAMQLRGVVYWMGPANFYRLTGNGVEVIPCPVWDAVFQNLNASFTQNIRAMPNTPFNEVGWLYPSSASSGGECDSYVKFNITEPGEPWDIGSLARSAWIDQSIFGNPISVDATGVIYQQESGNDAGGGAMTSSFTTGYFEIADGEDFVFVDNVVPDMVWGTYAGSQTASVQLSFNVVDYPGDTPRVSGPFTVTKAKQYITPRLRGRQMSVTLLSSDAGSFWRLGRIRYRYAGMGRR